MCAKVLAIANQKGGVGKTTTSISLSSALARMGKKVLVLDLDPHACATLHARIYPEGITCSLHDLFLAQEDAWPVIWPDLIHVQALPGMDVAPGSIRLSELEVDFRERQAKGSVLLRSLTHVRDEYDYIILDCPPHVGILLVNAPLFFLTPPTLFLLLLNPFPLSLQLQLPLYLCRTCLSLTLQLLRTGFFLLHLHSLLEILGQ